MGAKGAYNEPYVRYYLSHPAYHQYPVVGVTLKQAQDFCAWRTERVNEWAQANKKTDKLPAYFNYRLPSLEEYKMMYAEISELPNQIGEEGKKAYRGMMRYNMKRDPKDFMGVAGHLNDNADITAPALSYWPNESGVWNIKGNVNEWLLKENTYIGGGWSTPMESDVSVPMHLDSTSAAVGFRCVCEVSEESL
ncbi:MAG: SUMF1/EgtB/PvdO family nonheme iron enzyme [Flavobacteriales bacterium]